MFHPKFLTLALVSLFLSFSAGALHATETRGAEVRVNTFTAGSQFAPSIAVNATGDYVIAWISDGQDGSSYGIYAQRFSSLGVPKGAEFRVNTFTTGNQSDPSVAINDDGDFVITWDSAAQDGIGYGIYAQRYSAAGVAQGGEFRVNTFITGDQSVPRVAMDALGNFVITWQSIGQDGNTTGVYAQRYNASGVAQGVEFRVNTFSVNVQASPFVAMNAGGDFIITWTSYLQDGSDGGIYAQRYDAMGVPAGSEFRVNTFVADNQFSPVVALNAAGEFIIVWTSTGQDGNGEGVFARRYSAAGVALDSEFQVNTYTTGQQRQPSLAMDPAGDFTIAWQSQHDGDLDGIFAQRYNAAGTAEGSEFQVNTYTTGPQTAPTIGMDAHGDFVVAWQSFGQDTSVDGIYAQRFRAVSPTKIGPEFRVNTYTQNDQVRPAIARNASGDFVIAWESQQQDGDSGGIYAQRYNAAGEAQGSEFQVNTGTVGQQGSPAIGIDAAGNFVIVWFGLSQSNFSNLEIYAQRYDATGLAQGGEFKVNTDTTHSHDVPSVAMDSGGDFVIAWQSVLQDDVGGHGIYAQRFDATGATQGSEFLVNTTIAGDQTNPSVAMSTGGDFVITWLSKDQVDSVSGNDVYGQRYNAAGIAQAGEFLINTTTTSDQDMPTVAMDAAGDFVVAWRSLGSIYAQRYNLAGAAQGSQFLASSSFPSSKEFPSIAMDAEGDFVVTWDSGANQDGSSFGVFAQRYNSLGVAVDLEFQVNTYTQSSQRDPAVAMNGNGEFVIAWASPHDGSAYGIYSQVFRQNHAPTNFDTYGTGVDENLPPNQYVTVFTPIDADPGETFTYALVAGAGSDDNAAFQLVGNELRTLAPLDFETKQIYTLRLRVTDVGGLSFEKSFTIEVQDVNEAPTDIALSSTSIPENAAANTAVGTLSTTDPDAGNTFTYTLVAGTGDTDNAAFQVSGNQLRAVALFDFETKTSYSIRVRTTDSTALSFEKAFTINVSNVNESPLLGSFGVSAPTAKTGQSLTFSATATDVDDTVLTYTWTFSDSTTLTGASVSKSFLAAGIYTAFVTVVDGGGATVTSGLLTVEISAPATGSGNDSDGDNFSDAFEAAAGTSMDGATEPQTYDFKALRIDLNFSTKVVNKDSITLTGSLPTTLTDFTDKTAAVDIGGVIGLFELDKKGKSTKGEWPAFSIGKPNKKTTQAAITVTFKNASFKEQLAGEGLTNAVTPKVGSPVTIAVVVGFDGVIRTESVQLTYKLTKVGGKASAK